MVSPIQTSIKRALSPEVTVVEDAVPETKKPRLSAVGADKDKVNVGNVSTRSTKAASSTTTGISAAKPTTTKKPAAAASSAVKKTIFMPGCKYPSSPCPPDALTLPPPVGPKPTEPTISASLRANLSVTVTSTTSSDTAALKKEFIDALPEEMKQLLEMEIETMGDDWFVALRGEFVKPYFKEVGPAV